MLADAGFVVFLAWVSSGIGSRMLVALKADPPHPGHALAQAIPLGLGILSLSALSLGLVGRLDQPHLTGLLGLSMIAAIGPGSRLILDAARLAIARAWRTLARGTSLDRTLLVFAVAALFGCCLVASLPVTDGDALCYHLQVPKVFLARSAVVFEPDLHETIYPLITEMLYALTLQFRGPEACRWVQLLLGLVFASNVSLLAQPVLRRQAWWAGAIALLVPAITNGMTAPLNDVALAAFGTAAIAATMRAVDRPTIGIAAIAGCFMGFALGVKYPAIVLFGLLTLLLSARAIAAKARTGGETVRAPVRLTMVFIAFAVLFGGSWYLRAFIQTGNPVFPYFRQVFGGSGLDEVLDPTRRAMSVTPWNVLTALVPMTLSPDRFESFSHQFGPVFLLFLPAIAFERPPRRVLLLLAIGYSFLMICVTQRQSMRFVLTALGPLAVGVAYLARKWTFRRTLPARLLCGVLIVVLGMQSAQALARCRNGLGFIVGTESTEHYLATREPTYRVGRWIQDHLAEEARLIGQDHRGYYLPRHYTMELAHRRRTGLGRGGESAHEILEHLRRSGFTHLLLCPPVPEGSVEFDPTLGRILEPWTSSRKPVYREELADADGVIRRYEIHSLDEPSAIVSTIADDSEGRR